uniref:Integrase catalytic domain-containing protein n=1 Tax=Fagus sylvatica TaxID=28930 RepID=A0A2N9IS94_FAGSY
MAKIGEPFIFKRHLPVTATSKLELSSPTKKFGDIDAHSCSKIIATAQVLLWITELLHHSNILRLSWRSSAASAISGIAPPPPSEFRCARYRQGLNPSPKTRCLHRIFYLKPPIETPPPPLDRSSNAELNRIKISAIQRRTPHAPPEDSTRRHALSRATRHTCQAPCLCHFIWDQLDLADPPWDTPNDAMKYATRRDQMRLYQFLMALHNDYEPIRDRKYNKFCQYCKKHGHTIETCYRRNRSTAAVTHGDTDQTPTAVVAPAHSGSSITLTTDQLEDIIAQALVWAGNASSSSALSVLPGKFSSWLLDSAYCNHMTPYPSFFSHTSSARHAPTIHTTNGSTMLVRSIGTVSTSKLSISDVFYVPKLSYNLLSVGQLDELSYRIILDYFGCVVQDPRTGQELGTGRRIGRLFEISNLRLPATGVSAATSYSHSLSLWHSRLGHASSSRVQQLVSRGLLGPVSKDNFDCVSYQLGKQPALPFHNSTSQQNGKSERKLQHVLDTVRALLLSSKVPVPFWGEAVLTAAHAINQVSTASLELFPPSLEVSTSISQTESFDHSSGSSSNETPHSSSESPAPAPSKDPTPATTLRRSSRVTSLPSHLRDFHCYTTLTTLHEPHSYHEASSNPLWQAAMIEELDALSRNRTWDLVDMPPDKSMVGCFTQEYGIDYEETFAPVARLSSVCTLLVVAASRQWKLFQMDVKNAFLNGDLSEEAYMQPPLGLSHPLDKVCQLRRALYGTILLLLYVDDMIITGDDISGIQELKDFLSQNFEMKDLGHLSYFLGLEITSFDDGFYLTQAKYTSDLLSRAGLTDQKIVDTPIELNACLTPSSGELLSDPTLYRQLVGSLVYLIVTRPDMSYAVHQVSQFMSAPRSTHYAVVLRILRYLKGTLFHGLHFFAQSPLILRAYSDANWAGDPTDRRSTTGYCFLLGSSLISWRNLGVSTFSATPIYCDNRSAIQIAHNDVFHERTKHIEINCHLVPASPSQRFPPVDLCFLSRSASRHLYQVTSHWTFL